MVANAAQDPTSAPRTHPLDHLVNDPTGTPPLCDRDTFQALMQDMAVDAAPRRFAVMQEYGDRVDARCAGWGMAFGDRVEVIALDGSLRWSASSPEATLRGFAFGSHIAPHLVWVDPEAPEDPDDPDDPEESSDSEADRA